ncbi:hypothetical protein O181_094739 [Austropuccinia psidii MF-1]|uniref:Uncharacterized protein n=1 Tax=Austropuccinia psidii MF-1 TaxID=1389203 RepID=A0A9Q3J405_9BASI|nr:hypothetical protein [Austropuccinia psidii MF-1]
MTIQIHEPSPTPGGDNSFNACLALVNRYSEPPIFLPCHKDDTDINTAIMICNKVIIHKLSFQNNISDRDPKLTSSLWKNLHNLFGKKLSFSKTYHPVTDALEEE